MWADKFFSCSIASSLNLKDEVYFSCEDQYQPAHTAVHSSLKLYKSVDRVQSHLDLLLQANHPSFKSGQELKRDLFPFFSLQLTVSTRALFCPACLLSTIMALSCLSSACSQSSDDPSPSLVFPPSEEALLSGGGNPWLMVMCMLSCSPEITVIVYPIRLGFIRCVCCLRLCRGLAQLSRPRCSPVSYKKISHVPAASVTVSSPWDMSRGCKQINPGKSPSLIFSKSLALVPATPCMLCCSRRSHRSGPPVRRLYGRYGSDWWVLWIKVRAREHFSRGGSRRAGNSTPRRGTRLPFPHVRDGRELSWAASDSWLWWTGGAAHAPRRFCHIHDNCVERLKEEWVGVFVLKMSTRFTGYCKRVTVEKGQETTCYDVNKKG